MSEPLLVLGVRLAGAFHFVTLVLACFTPIPPDWEKNLAGLPLIHRRFALAQNVSIGAMITVLGLFSLCFAPELVAGSPLARAVCAATGLFWGGRLGVLPWLGVRPMLTTPLLKLGYGLLLAECAVYAYSLPLSRGAVSRNNSSQPPVHPAGSAPGIEPVSHACCS